MLVIDELNTCMSKECWWNDTDRGDPVLNLYEMLFNRYLSCKFMYKDRIWTWHGLSVTSKRILCSIKLLRTSCDVFM